MSNLALALIAVVVTVAAALTWSPSQPSAAEQAVRSFLEEVHAGEVDAALERIVDAPSGPFLTPEALNADWEIVEVAQVGYEREEDGDRTAQVYAEIRADDGTRLAHRYEVQFEDGEPLIADRLTGGKNYTADLFEVNGVTGRAMEVYLLPGVYHFYGSVPSVVDANMPSMLVLGGRFIELGGEHTTDRLIEPRPEFSAEGEAAVNAALREYLHTCAVSRGEGCPFGRLAEDGPFAEADPSEPWRIVEYPTVALEGWKRAEDLHLMTVEAGAVELDVVPADPGEDAEPITVSCAFGADRLFLDIDPGTGEVGIRENRTEPNTCEWLSE